MAAQGPYENIGPPFLGGSAQPVTFVQTVHFTIWDKYILQFETNTFHNSKLSLTATEGHWLSPTASEEEFRTPKAIWIRWIGYISDSYIIHLEHLPVLTTLMHRVLTWWPWLGVHKIRGSDEGFLLSRRLMWGLTCTCSIDEQPRAGRSAPAGQEQCWWTNYYYPRRCNVYKQIDKHPCPQKGG